MVPVPIAIRNSHSSRLLHILFTVGTQYVSYFIRLIFFKDSEGLSDRHPFLVRRHEPTHPQSVKFIVFASLIPLLVLLSGLFAGLTLGYMSLDETQLNVLSISGTPYVNAFYHSPVGLIYSLLFSEQRKYAKQIMPVRKNGHLLLVTLLLVNMIVNETLPVIADPVLGGGVQGVIVSTALIVM
jgi:metal transporter CNNM